MLGIENSEEQAIAETAINGMITNVDAKPPINHFVLFCKYLLFIFIRLLNIKIKVINNS